VIEARSGSGRRGHAVARLGSGLAFGLLLWAWADTALAEIKEYQIRRMLLLKTACGVSGLDRSGIAPDPSPTPLPAPPPADRYTDRFLATCENATHYPDGVEILCPDTEDERDCRLVTRPREFPHLDSLRR